MSAAREDAPADKVSGRAVYAADVAPPDAVEVVFVYASVARARIRAIDVSDALAVEGVLGVVTGADLGPFRFGRAIQDLPVLAVDEVLFAGQRVAAVAAVDRATAALAAGLVDVDYDDLPPLDTVAAASHPDADPLHPGYDGYVGHRPDRPHPNQQGFQELVVGDPDAGWADPHLVLDEVYQVARSHSAPLEPHACVVAVAADRVDVWSSHKEPFTLRRQIAALAELPAEAVTVHPVTVGGDFGGKGSAFQELACWAVARAVGRPVRSVMTYSEMLLSTSARHGAHLRLRTATRAGRVTAHRLDATLDGGAFAAHKAHPLGVVFVTGFGLEPYVVPARDERCEAIYTSSLPASHVRGPGLMQSIFASECHLDELAWRLGHDPIAFRRRHAEHPETVRVLDALERHIDAWRAEAAGRPTDRTTVGRGIGVAAFLHRTGFGTTTVEVEAVLGDGVEVRVAVPDQGAGAHDSVRALAVRELGLDERLVRVRQIATDSELPDAGAGASRVTTVVGHAVVAGCRALLAEVGPLDGPAAVDAALHRLGRGRLAVRGTGSLDWFGRASFGALAVDVSVARTGKLHVHRAALVADTGGIVNPIGHRGQLEGAFVFGLSQALYEQLDISDGQVMTTSLGDYDVAKCADVPPLDIEVVDADRAPSIDEIGSVGELANLGVAPAIANAVAAATGARVRRLPMTPDVVWAALQEGGPHQPRSS